MSQSDSSSPPGSPGGFPTTHWSMVIEAGRDSSPGAREAFGRLYRLYLPALLAYLRRQGCTEDAAREVTQGFFEVLLEKRRLSQVRPEGRFRCWLLVCLKRHVMDLWDKARAEKRGGDQVIVPLDPGTDDLAPVDPPGPGRTPDQDYDYHYALAFVEGVITQLEQEYRRRGRHKAFEILHGFLLEKKGDVSRAELGRQLDMGENAVDKEISRMRQRFRLLFDGELGKLVSSPADLQEEKQYLLAALSR